MSNVKKYTTQIGSKNVEVTLGKYAFQSNGSCIVTCDDTIIMVNITMSKAPKEGQSFFPLSVDFEEKLYAVGKIPGGFKRREGRPSDEAILTSRLIDRPLRPLFPEGMFNDVSITVTPLSVDPDVSPEPLAMFASSVALSISNIPFDGPTGSVNVAYVNNNYIINPSISQKQQSVLDLTVSGTKDAILMVEANANEVSEDVILNAISFGHEEIKKQVDFQEKLVKELNIKKADINLYKIATDLKEDVTNFSHEKVEKVMENYVRCERQVTEKELEDEVLEHFSEKYPDNKNDILEVLTDVKKEIMRNKILNLGIRPDGRKTNEIRPIWCEVGILPRVHGSGVFTRGETQALTTLTLGSSSSNQILDGLQEEESEKRYMHHYNMPPYSVGEARQHRGPGRREIGHGALAERALMPVLPSEDEFPYTIRMVSEILSSNGSTSQASICGCTLALMDGGVPIKSPVAGIAMGLIKDEKTKNVQILTDIQGLEDFLGDMDFKVAGTKDGITAIQMDMKIKGIDSNVLKTALNDAHKGRMHILGKMEEAIKEPRTHLSTYAPKIITFSINPDKIKDVIGSGGKTINKIIDETGVKIDIEDDGRVCILGVDEEKSLKAKEIILSITEDVDPGKKYIGKVERIMNFGAFVSFGFNKEGMIHISKLSSNRVEKVEDVINLGDKVEVEVIKIDEKERIDLKLISKL